MDNYNKQLSHEEQCITEYHDSENLPNKWSVTEQRAFVAGMQHAKEFIDMDLKEILKVLNIKYGAVKGVHEVLLFIRNKIENNDDL
jgi:hypothetical protein